MPFAHRRSRDCAQTASVLDFGKSTTGRSSFVGCKQVIGKQTACETLALLRDVYLFFLVDVTEEVD
jgi:hypothetical protein